MKSYAFLLPHAPDRYENLAKDEYMEIIKDYAGWIEKLTQAGVFRGGHKLSAQPGKTVTSSSGSIDVHDSPFAELPEVLGGIIIVAADDMDAAVETARTCPHLEHNSKLEIRELDEME